MTSNISRIFSRLCAFIVIPPAGAVTVTINTDSAQSVLVALQNPGLSHDQALKIAGMPGNQGIIRKMNEFNIPATAGSFARALVAAAHNSNVTQANETIFDFASLKLRAPKVLDLIKEINEHPEAFQSWIEQRVELFSLPNSTVKLQGYVVAGGDGGGYAFDEPIFPERWY